MAYIGNSPDATTVLHVEARKSFALSLHIMDEKGRPANLTGCQLTIVAKPLPIDTSSDATNILAASALARLTETSGYAQFDIQASSLNQPAGEYPYAIVLRQDDGYSSVIVKGALIIEENTEVASVFSNYSLVQPPQSMSVQLRNRNTIKVFIGGQLPPGMNYVRDDVIGAIESFDPDSVAYVPEGGSPGYVLTKTGSGDYTMAWLPVGNGEFALDATNQPSGYVPVAVGDDTWIWDAVGIDASGVTAGWAPLANGDGTWSWSKVSTAKPDWTAAAGAEGEILNKPTLGSIASRQANDFLAVNQALSTMNTVHVVSTIPATGTNGHFYFVYEE